MKTSHEELINEILELFVATHMHNDEKTLWLELIDTMTEQELRRLHANLLEQSKLEQKWYRATLDEFEVALENSAQSIA